MNIMFLGNAIISVEVKVFKVEHILNLMRNNSFEIRNLRKIDAVTIRFDIRYKDYKAIKKFVKSMGGKIKIKSNGKLLSFFITAKKSIALVVGACLFSLILFGMSKFIWRINIESKNYLPPYEVRNYLKGIGISPGIRKSSIDVYDIEKKVEKNMDGIMWINVRIEGSTLMVKFEEKKATNIREKKEEDIGSEKVAKMDGVVKRIYTSSGTAAVKDGDTVKKGDVLIKGEEIISDLETDGVSESKKVIPEGVVIADTLYEKIVELKVSGEEEVYTNETDEEIYLDLFGKKIYLKKAKKDFKSYDKIEHKGKIIKKNVYHEKKVEKINKSEEAIIEEAIAKLEKATVKEISRQAVIVDKKKSTEDIGDGKILLKVLFVVEQDIVSF